jgi:hypothetical protein
MLYIILSQVRVYQTMLGEFGLFLILITRVMDGLENAKKQCINDIISFSIRIIQVMKTGNI